GYNACVQARAASEPQKRTRAAVTAETLAPPPGVDQPNGPMCGARGRVSEKARDFPEPGATARSQSFFVAFSFIFARKMPLLLAATYPTVVQLWLLPCRSWIVTRASELVASRPQTLTADFPR